MTTSEIEYDDAGKVRFHDSCVTDANQPTFQEDWQRRAFGLAVALSEFDHYSWDDFQGELIASIDAWEKQGVAASSWEYYDHWVAALQRVVDEHGLLADDYIGPRERDHDHADHDHEAHDHDHDHDSKS